MPLAGRGRAQARCLSSDSYPAKLLEGLEALRSREALCDVTLEAGGVAFPAHRAVLAAASGYCRGRFGRDGPGPEAPVRLPSVTARGLQRVLAFVYSNRLELSLGSVEETFEAAEALLVREVACLCLRFLEEALDRHTCLEVLRVARRLGPEELARKAMRCVGRHCGEILADPPRLHGLDKATLCAVLDSPEAGALGELELFHAAAGWLSHDSARRVDAADVLRRIRFPLIPLQDLQGSVGDTPAVRSQPACRRFLQEALDYHARPYAQPALQSERTEIRGGVDTLLVLGGRTAENAVCREVWAAEPGCGSWGKVGELQGPLYNHSVAALGGFVFVMGGQARFDPTGQQPSNKVFRFDPRHATWLQVASMLERRTRFHAGTLSDRLVAVGGGALLGALTNTAEEYRLAENEWRPVTPFPTPVADHAGVTHQGILYVSGGFAAGKTLRDTYSYLCRLRRWIMNRPMTFARCDHSMAAVGDRIFCVGGRALNDSEDWVPVTETERYCPASDQWTLLSPLPLGLCQFGLATHQARLHLTGGGSLRRRRKEDGVWTCDPSGTGWERAGALPTVLVDHACCVVRWQRQASREQPQKTAESPAARRKKSTVTLFLTNNHVPQPAL
ncbi:hypothetical protein lerEdw1_015892 [Lerista edwardsae]|nr:hypothetical protein lerEdw1_015892 [Lerista edwardsae]